MARCSRWPFRPVHITNDGELAGQSSELRMLTGEGVISNEWLQGIQSQISEVLDYPTTVIEFSPHGLPVKTNSPLLRSKLRGPCKAFRDISKALGYPDAHLCMQSDELHAKLFFGLNRSLCTRERIMAAWNDDKELQLMYSGEPACYRDIRTIDGRMVMEYDCPLLGYGEVIHPLYIGENVVGIFFLGQMVINSRPSRPANGQAVFMHERIRGLSGRMPGCFLCSEYRADVDPKRLMQEVIAEHEEWLRGNEPLAEDEYERLIRSSCEQVKRIEERLGEELERQKRRHVSEKVVDLIKAGRAAYVPELPITGETIRRFWDSMEGILRLVLESFGLRYCIGFGVDEVIDLEEDDKPLCLRGMVAVAADGTPPPAFADRERLSGVLLNLAPNIKETLIRVMRRGLNDYLGKLDMRGLGDCELMILPAALLPEASIAFLIGYRDKAPVDTENSDAEHVRGALETFSWHTLATIASTMALFSKGNANNQMRILGHEAGQILGHLHALIQHELSDAEKLKSDDLPRIERHLRENAYLVEQLEYLFGTADWLTKGLPTVSIENFLPYRDLLYRWQSLFRQEISHGFKEIRVAQGIAYDDQSRPKIRADRKLLSQVIYNLIGNAIKYCYLGTNIYMNMRLKDMAKGSPYILTIVDYGTSIPEGPEVYKMWFRAPDNTTEGLGIGLAHAKSIVTAHRGDISHSCQKISDYNVPLIRPYLEMDYAYVDVGLRRVLEDEDKRLKQARLYDEVVAINAQGMPRYGQPTPNALVEYIADPTYRVELLVTIPTGEEET
jgi:signal transduction histidine kinase